MGRRSQPQAGTVYLIHFETRLHHAGHYLGYCDDLGRRLAQHRGGNGARLMEVISSAGIAWKVVRTWAGDRAFERRLKKRKNTPRRLCPVCMGLIAYDAVDEPDVLSPTVVAVCADGDPENDPPF
jgi:predicted GIY-YIG superfamily endonuclease